MRIEIVVFDGFDPLDVIAPWEVFVRAAALDTSIEVALVRPDGAGPVTSAYGLQMQITETLGTPDGLLVPGGSWVDSADTGVRHEIQRGTLPRAIAELATSVRWVASVCTGALLLGAAGILRGRYATTNSAALEELSRYGAVVKHHRVVDDGTVVTAGGVTSGVDLALWLVQRELCAQTAGAVRTAIAYPVPQDVWRTPDTVTR
ncbi:DJ-1/PfpI family protein [Mycolicibacterium holsaticum]|uniref:Thiamine biosynthesis protein ThiJ n=1 Tax=Mycolicibacterium holsaticum TaxID=152142 RepID=A0A1E3RDP0_9MYCO|nr:DJ-1/PfpI family protein [Mycolicibacterium holsaticum]MDA4107780.1 thiazole biosynthesis protein ThiJ [Mycolicibacterium holsaticum DSM 44478 = JCM 12374]ODQ87985.1 thiamine biosynthesis protein ThiJ [Mycolicibacterium holsaticum]QZA14771.1 DJ-1/PfpI family protein [Mycolicibacterium holsaticum DSM 44478 = JCM 12374]UNC07786.1 DJ-1/PfpI family protein [Mycolicibacterium holsaticum DSM 44478 = JCM 12374]